MQSVWSSEDITFDFKRNDFPEGGFTADAVVIGGGMAGILTAYFLHQHGLNTVLIEAGRLAGGVTKNTTAKITAQHSLIYDKLIKDFGKEQAYQYAQANQSAVQRYNDIINNLKIQCDFEEKSAFVYSLDNEQRIWDEVKAANKLNLLAQFVKETTLPFDIMGAVKLDSQAQFNPLKFIKGVSSNLQIYEYTMAFNIEENIITTNKGKIKADHIVVATHYPFINAPGYYFMRMHQQRSYVVALKGAQQLNGMYIDADESGFSFRNYKDLLFLGGAGHRTGENTSGGCYDKLKTAASKFYPDSTVEHCWSAQDCMSIDGVPYIGRYSSSTENLYVATGFNKWGMTGSMVSAQIISDMILNHENEFENVFSPQRFKLSASAKNLVKDGATSISGLVFDNMKIPESHLKDLDKGHGGIIEYNGHKSGVYKNEDGEVFVVSINCPHLGCVLEWNPDELSWDCPCHGSRFDYKGNLINNPAMKDIKISE